MSESNQQLEFFPPTVSASEAIRIKRESAEFQRVVAEWGPLVLPAVAARVVGLSQQRVSQLIQAGQLETWSFFGQTYVSLPQLQFRQSRPRPVGGPRKKA